jgi:two-component system sensor kinase FixL
MLFFLLRGSRTAVTIRAFAMIALIAVADWRIEGNVPLGFLYLFPMLLVGSVLSRWQIGTVAVLCTFLAESFDSFEWLPQSGIPRDILVFAAFFGMGLFVYETVRNRQLEQKHMREIESESEARRDAEEQLAVLVESSPAAIFTADSNGIVLLANAAAHRLLGLTPSVLPGKSISDFLPSMVTIPQRESFRTVMQCRGRRQNGDAFLADVWFSTYRTSAGYRLAAMVLDTSEELRTREEFSLNQLLASSRILVGAVSHEIRNVCGAIAVVHENLARGGALNGSKDFQALGTLIVALEKIAAMDLRERDLRETAHHASGIDLAGLLEELRIVVELSLREQGIEVRWEIEPELPGVWADRQSLMQVFLNVVKNAARAMTGQLFRELVISARSAGPRITVQFRDTGCGVAYPDLLFRPFQPGAQATGLGLYLSRALMRSFRGDLRFEPEADGARFIVDLAPAPQGRERELYGSTDPDLAGRRPQPVPGESQPAAPGRT